MQTMDKNIDMIVGVVGDERLTLKQIMHKLNGRCSVSDEAYNKSNVYHWLLRSVRTGMLDRVRIPSGNLWEFAYYKSARKSSKVVRKSFVVQAHCPGCGHERRIVMQGSSCDVESTHATMTWSCSGCGDFVRFSECLSSGELLRSYAAWFDSRNPDKDIRLTCLASKI